MYRQPRTDPLGREPGLIDGLLPSKRNGLEPSAPRRPFRVF